MDIQLTSDIKDILMDNGTVIIPKFGAFMSAYKPAVTDGVEGVLHPPSYSLTFDPNGQANDGKLIAYICEKYGISNAAAQDSIDVFVKDIQTRFEQNEIFIFPEIGRLYYDFTRKIQFLPEITNFNIDTFGLPSLNFSPISRTKTDPIQPKSAPKPFFGMSLPETDKAREEKIPAQSSTLYKEKTSTAFLTPTDDAEPPNIIQKPNRKGVLPTNWLDYTPIVAVLLIAILAILIWKNTNGLDVQNTEGGKKTEPNVNVSPHNPTNINENKAPNNNVTQQSVVPPHTAVDSATVKQPLLAENKKQDSIATLPPNSQVPKMAGSHKALIIIGGFANKSNILKLEKWITEQGYGLYEKQKQGGLTEVGCEISYELNGEFDAILKKIKARYGNDIVVLKK